MCKSLPSFPNFILPSSRSLHRDAKQPGLHPSHAPKRVQIISLYAFLIRATHLPNPQYQRIDRRLLEWALDRYGKLYEQAFGSLAFNMYAHLFCVSYIKLNKKNFHLFKARLLFPPRSGTSWRSGTRTARASSRAPLGASSPASRS